ncbi:glycoside hydrolase [Carboxylicivirga linearis]|uniref:RICIN domain-containing protein n=1 Tax=Carboxylicivirga linearis TaxID=1628157 RepID=A0ABS5JS56_9BACT|nr:glycoside hydrolase [Carboxylicivirga linearis]MBS2097682.1 RICIN domain-containing protein [Carboxylicivirga linearis]
MKKTSLKYTFVTLLTTLIFSSISFAQIIEPKPSTDYYLIHSSGNVVAENTETRTVIKEVSGSDDQIMHFIPDGTGYYWIKLKDQKKFMALSGSWNTYFITDSTTDYSKYAIEKVSSSFVRLKCKANSRYLGTDDITDGSYIYSDKSGTESRHYWYISEEYHPVPADTIKYLINPNARFTNSFEGWGVSLCWWANMCGTWSDDKIDEIVDWLVSPEGLNYNIFRYNIGGGDDPLNQNCDPHHMASGKGIRAEMEGFKDSSDGDYDWSRDAAQRKIMLKIKEKRPDAIFEAFSNSAPYYMTYSGCCAGNFNAWEDNLKPEYYEEFANYLVDVCKHYKETYNIEFKTLEPFNEPVTNYWAANGGQEGCHFSTAAQIDFLKILSPILKESGLNTVISASDETSVAQSVTDFNAYIADGTVLDLVDQWNTHTYSATNQDRANIRALSTTYNKTLWMSEVGAGGTGLYGNLNMAQKLIHDIRYIRPEAWIDWQYIEENNDQWCLVQGDFAAQTYEPVKNFYVRKQFSHYIKTGARFLDAPNDQILSTLNETNDTLTIVLLNNSSLTTYHEIDLSMFDQVDNPSHVTRTSETENNIDVTSFKTEGDNLLVSLPGYSLTTVVIPVNTDPVDNELQTDIPYLILSRTASLVMQSTDNEVQINNYQHTDSTQLWVLSSNSNGYTISNLKGEYLTDAGTYYLSTSSVQNPINQTFLIESVGDDCYKIVSTNTGKALDLEGANNTAGTKVGLYDYGTSAAASHRQWMFAFPPSFNNQDIPNNINEIEKDDHTDLARIIGTKGAILVLQASELSGQACIYTLSGIEVAQQEIKGSSSLVPVKRGIYIVRYNLKKQNSIITTKVFVK